MFEIRIPTYNRQKLLQRACQSLQAQTYTDWQATILDDSPDKSALPVLESLNDTRFTYLPNQSRLGRCGNLARAFSPSPFHKHSIFACVLEDDNFFAPLSLENAVATLSANPDVDVLARPVRIALHRNEEIIEDDQLYPPEAIGLGNEVLPEITRLQLCLAAYGLPNAGYCWRITPSRVDLSAGSTWVHEHVQERLRTVQPLKYYYLSTDRSVFASAFRTADAPKKIKNTTSFLKSIESQGQFSDLLRAYFLQAGSPEKLLKFANDLNTGKDTLYKLNLTGYLAKTQRSAWLKHRMSICFSSVSRKIYQFKLSGASSFSR